MIVNKAFAAAQLDAELTAAGVQHRKLGWAVLGATSFDLHTYDAQGLVAELPPAAAAVIAAHVPAPPPLVFTGSTVVKARVRTTNATPTEVYRVTLTPLTLYDADLKLTGVDAGSGAARRIRAAVVAKRLANGALLVGAPQVIADQFDAAAAAWAITAAASGTDFVVTVTGASGRTIDWLLSGDVASFTPGGA